MPGRQVAQCFRVQDGDAQQGLGRARRVAAALFPVLQGTHADAQQFREIRLGQADAAACFADARRLPPGGMCRWGCFFHDSFEGRAAPGCGRPEFRPSYPEGQRG